ncbi:endo alpha-1,4 polygalactosaminidase [Nocardioides sp.]|uniref:endo alpha-1,4 polygalactosaminidase n=1 Tax=Nocardioides sp. TaxID=35761 RepID=UPI00352791F7
MRGLVLSLTLAATLAVGAAPAAADVTLPSPKTDVDYQLGGNKALPKHVGIVVRDRTAKPSKRAYSVCYVNGFQTQPNERSFWRNKHWGLVLKKDGKAVVDSAWGEWLLDIRTPAKRKKLARIMGRWVAGCADDGYEGVEFDNLDSFTRSGGLLKARHAKNYARLLVSAAHEAGLAAAQKNRAGWDGTTVGYDFAIAEECGRWKECGRYRSHYGNHVIVVEYRKKDFRYACKKWGAKLPIVLRDLDLTPQGIHRYC